MVLDKIRGRFRETQGTFIYTTLRQYYLIPEIFKEKITKFQLENNMPSLEYLESSQP